MAHGNRTLLIGVPLLCMGAAAVITASQRNAADVDPSYEVVALADNQSRNIRCQPNESIGATQRGESRMLVECTGAARPPFFLACSPAQRIRVAIAHNDGSLTFRCDPRLAA